MSTSASVCCLLKMRKEEGEGKGRKGKEREGKGANGELVGNESLYYAPIHHLYDTRCWALSLRLPLSSHRLSHFPANKVLVNNHSFQAFTSVGFSSSSSSSNG